MNDELDKMMETDLPLGPKSVRTVQAKATLSGEADMGKGQKVVRSKRPRVIVSVAFSAEDAEVIANNAALNHEYVSRYIRRVVLEHEGQQPRSLPGITEERVREIFWEMRREEQRVLWTHEAP